MSQKQQEEILRGKQATFGEFIWNGETGQFLGRTGGSWGKIFAFYCIYYGFLAAFFSLCMFLFYQTLDTENYPKYTPGNKDSILRNPSLGYRPRPPKDKIESSMIYYSNDDKATYDKWTSSINALIEGNEDSRSKGNYLVKEKIDNIVACNATTELKEGQVCNYDISMLGEKCTKDLDWGYAERSPCILLKLNRMMGWTPKVFENLKELPEDMPKQLKDHIEGETTKNDNKVPKMLWVSCDGETPMDKEMLAGGVEYAPTQGFPSFYFPYNNQPNYKSPILAVQFIKPNPNVLIHVRCTLYANDITYSNKDAIGGVGLQLLIEQKKDD